ncbi:hypothetical protein GGI13_005753 [Coemansia sp. RSA 455]|nr:hypothetical protein LPJ71_008659 [Coemansia sp. S17]KAJ2018308.1 hypothetical protein GGI14_002394 [Coemansia sp. S680]KAJ2034832.1 hypothetical protein H4S03_004715 [Coemansia sp. S3946]KAJ2043366.1 hypothetical protein H4S04_006797 [Coemansia sp. S16]KAJ2047179.1 hypothetical protein GGI08_006334 [Coemansia sp. S2]KAJ2086286.1 hypothetical protein GGI09_006722 [Coemansia sp. S100]KAJ2086871.1 hypothetical protein GGI16_006545 [Coemansia sp. S142-1]KAJ2100031.1 hypothetical protein IW14
MTTTIAAKSDERYQLTQLKEQLAEALGDDGPSYWAALRDFVQGKLNRQEFDFYAYLYLTGDKAVLHNQFILATIHNAQSGQAPPEGERSQGFEGRKKRKHEDDEMGDGEDETGDSRSSRRSVRALLEDPKWRYVKELVKSLNKSERRAIKTLFKQPNLTPEEAQAAIRAMKPVVLPMSTSQLPQSYSMDMAKGITAPLVFDTKSTPDIESLSYRMVSLALEQGLAGGVTREAGELLLYALDCHLKNILSNMIYKTRSNRALGIPVSRSRADDSWSSNINDIHDLSTSAGSAMRPTTGGLRLRDRLYQSKDTLHLADLVFSLTISPSTTVQPPKCIERCGNLMAGQVLADEADDTDADASQAELLPSSSSAPPMTPTSGALVIAAAGGGGEGLDDDDQKQRRKVRRLRARYERWFGSYVTVQYGGCNGSGGGGSAETHSTDA